MPRKRGPRRPPSVRGGKRVLTGLSSWVLAAAAALSVVAILWASSNGDSAEAALPLLPLFGDRGLLAVLGISNSEARKLIRQSYYNEDGSINPFPVIVGSSQFLLGECPNTIVDQRLYRSQVFQRTWPDGMTCAKVLVNLGNVLKEFCTAADCDRGRFSAVFHSAVASFGLAARGGQAVDEQQSADAERWHTHSRQQRSNASRHELLLDVAAVLQRSPVAEATPCDRVVLASSADFAAVLERNVPVLLSIADSAIRSHWETLQSGTTLQEMNATMAEHIVPVSLSPLCSFATVLHEGQKGWSELVGFSDGQQELLVRGAPVHMAFADALELVADTPVDSAGRGFCGYVEYLPLSQWLPALFQTALKSWNAIAGGSSADGWLRRVNLWLSSAAGTHSGLHFDLDSNLFFLARGRKHFFLYPPERLDQLGYHARADTTLRYKWPERPLPTNAKEAMRAQFAVDEPILNTFGSSLDPHEPDSSSNTAIPAELTAEALHCRVEPGEILYLPALWSHDVLTPALPEPSLGLNFWFRPQQSAPQKVQRFLRHLDAQLT